MVFLIKVSGIDLQFSSSENARRILSAKSVNGPVLSEEASTMKAILVSAIFAASVFGLGCAPADQQPPAAEPTPAAADDGTITEMDFESGEVEGADGTDGQGREEAPE